MSVSVSYSTSSHSWRVQQSGNVYTSETNGEKAGNKFEHPTKKYAIMKKTLAVAISWQRLLSGAHIDDGEVHIDGEFAFAATGTISY
jgi:hypothetical protein